MSEKLQRVCRVCLQENMTDSTQLFTPSSPSTDLPIAERLRLCTGVTFHLDENLPQIICHVCIDELNAAERLLAKCVVSEETLRKFLEAQNERGELVQKVGSIDGTHAIDVKEELDYHEDITTGGELTEPLEESEALGKPKTEHVCSECGKRLKSIANLKRHMVSMHERRQRVGRASGHGEERLYHCAECEYTTKHSQSLVYHMRRHTGERPHRCECGAAFTQPASLAAHRKTHSEHAAHTCATCGKQFKFKDSFERHQLVHSESKFRCPACGKKLKSHTSLQSHMNRHLGLRNFSCEKCGTAFVTHSELCNHRRKHDAAQRNRFQCHLCSYKTYAKKGLVMHLKRHTGERLFRCAVCPYDCYTQGELSAHQRSHTKEKRYACPRCGQRFVHSSSLNKHVRRAHDESFIYNNTIDRRVILSVA